MWLAALSADNIATRKRAQFGCPVVVRGAEERTARTSPTSQTTSFLTQVILA